MSAVTLDLRIFANNVRPLPHLLLNCFPVFPADWVNGSAGFSLCLQAEQQLQKKGKGQPGEMLEKAAEQLMSCFRVCASDKSVPLRSDPLCGSGSARRPCSRVLF